MKMLLMVDLPHEPFNALVRSGKASEMLAHILENIRPEAAYFTEQDGLRGGIFLVDVPSASAIPALAEPFFLSFQANCRFRIVMSPQDLQNAGLDAIGKQWS